MAGEDWQWKEEDLVFAGVGEHLENLAVGRFTPKVSIQAKKRRASKINTLIKYNNEVEIEKDQEDFVTFEDISAGEIPVTEYTEEKVKETEAKIKYLCTDFCEHFDKRVRPGDLIEKAVEIFHEDDYSWLIPEIDKPATDMTEDEKKQQRLVRETNLEKAMVMMKSLFETIQIKSFSEAVCETIGSIMSIAKGKGRKVF